MPRKYKIGDWVTLKNPPIATGSDVAEVAVQILERSVNTCEGGEQTTYSGRIWSKISKGRWAMCKDLFVIRDMEIEGLCLKPQIPVTGTNTGT